MGPAFGAQSNKRMPGQKAEKHKCKETVKEIDRESKKERKREREKSNRNSSRLNVTPPKNRTVSCQADSQTDRRAAGKGSCENLNMKCCLARGPQLAHRLAHPDRTTARQSDNPTSQRQRHLHNPPP